MNITDFSVEAAKPLGIGSIIRLDHTHGTERFILTGPFSRIYYFVSMDYGYAYTRPQLVDKYSKANAIVIIER